MPSFREENRKKPRFRTAAVVSAVLLCLLLFLSCDMFNKPLQDFVEEWTGIARILSHEFDTAMPQSDGLTNLASGADRVITYYLANPQNYTLDAGVNFAGGGLSHGTDYTIVQDSSDRAVIRLTLMNTFLETHDGNGTVISPTVTIKEPNSGRDFGSYTVPLRVNSAPPQVTSPVILNKTDNDTYVICFNMPDMTSIHRDIVSVGISGFFNKSYIVTAPAGSNGNGLDGLSGVTGTYDDTNYAPLSGGGAFLGNKTDRFVGIETGISLNSVSDPECTITLTDSSGLTSVVTASTAVSTLPAVTATASSGTLEPGDTVKFSHPTDGAEITLELSSTDGVFVEGGTLSGGTVTSGNTGVTLTFVKEGTYTVTATASMTGARDSTVTFTYTVPYSAMYVSNVGDDSSGTGSQDKPYATLDKAAEAIGNNGIIYVMDSVTTTGYTVSSGASLTVRGDSDGGSLTNSSGRVFTVESGGSLTLGENITLTGTNATGNGGAVYVAGGTFTMEDGSKITGSRAQNGGGVYIASGTFNLTGTAILQDNMATTHGGGVHIFSGGTFTMNGGTIDGTAQNTAEYGGGVFVSGGTFSMNDGTITGNKVTQSGGGVYVNNGTFTMKGGTIGGTTANTATQNGGGVFVQAGTFNMNGSAVIQGNEATGGSSPACGGGVYINGGTFTMNGTAIIQDNKATGTNGHACGGGVYVNSTGKFDMGDTATIQGNNASTTDTNSAAGGGGVYVNGGTFTMTGTAKIQGNTTTSTDSVKTPSGGGGVFVIAGGTFTMSGGSIGGTEANSANEADLGGGVYVGVNADTGEKGSFTMGGGTIKGNTATQNGGGVYVNGGTFTMNGGGITGNESDGNGGGVYLDDTNAKVTLNNTSSISGNVAAGEGGGVYVGNGTFTLSGSPNISRNGLDGLNNVYLTNGNAITIGDKGLTGGEIGVTAEAITTGGVVQITNKNVPGADGIFTSDVKGYAIVESSGAVYLSDAETKYVGTDGTETFGAFETALADVDSRDDGGPITLLKDIDGTNAVFKDAFSQPQPITFTGGTETKPIILDLNGKTINRGLSAATNNGSVIKIEGGTLTIKDSSAAPDGTGGTGTITGGNSSGGGGGIHITDKSGGGIHGSLILESGNISGNTADMSLGGGIYIDSDCAFTMKGGSIDGNTVKNSDGGGVFVYGTFTMENGSITNNRSEQGNGGGVNIGSYGNFTMTGGTIGGTEPNTAVLGGGVYVSGSSNFTLGILETPSSPVIFGNTKTGSSPNNVYLSENTLLHIAGKLNKTEESVNIGVSMASPGEGFTSGWSDSGLPDSTFFFSDDTQYKVEVNDNGELQLINK